MHPRHASVNAAGGPLLSSSSAVARNALRPARRGQHRVSSRRRARAGPGHRPRLHLTSGSAVDGPRVQPFPGTARLFHTLDPVRQATHRPLRSDPKRANARGTDRGHQGSTGRRRGGAGCPAWLLGRWSGVRPFRDHLARSDECPHLLRHIRPRPPLRGGAPRGGRDPRGVSTRCFRFRGCGRALGRGKARHPDRTQRPKRVTTSLLGCLRAGGRESGYGAGADRVQHASRRDVDPADDSSTDASSCTGTGKSSRSLPAASSQG